MSGGAGCDLFWVLDPLPVIEREKRMSYDNWKTTEPDPSPRCNSNVPEQAAPADRCERCTALAYGSFPGHVFCRPHFAEHQAKVIAEMVARSQRRTA